MGARHDGRVLHTARERGWHGRVSLVGKAAIVKLFPAVRISELRALQRRDRQKLAASSAELKSFVREKTRPVRFLLDHSGAIAGGIGSLLAIYGIGTSVFAPVASKVASAPARKTIGIVGRLARVGLGVAVRSATPALTSLISRIWRSTTKLPTPPDPDNSPV